MKTLTNPDPAVLLDQLLEQAPTGLTIVTGHSGAGKTTWCAALLESARALNLSLTGLLSPPVFAGTEKTGIDLVDLSTGNKRRLAERRPEFLPDAPTHRWLFDDEVVQWANQVLGAIPACDILLLDELGPLEFKFNQGFAAAFPALEQATFKLGVVVVRPSLLEQAYRRWSVDTLVELSRE